MKFKKIFNGQLKEHSKFRFKGKVIASLLFLLLVSPVSTQFYDGSNRSGSGSPLFNVELFRTFSEDNESYRVYFYYEVINDNLTFIKKGTSTFSAKFDLISAVYDEENNVILTKSFYKEIVEKDYRDTNSPDKKVMLNNYYDLSPGKYVLKFKLNDLNSNKSTTQQINIELKEFQSKKLAMSDIIFIQNNPMYKDSLRSPRDFIIKANNNFPAPKGPIYIYFDFYTKQLNSEIEIDYRLKNKKGKTEIDTTVKKIIDSHLTGHYLTISKESLSGNKYTCIITVKDKDYKVTNEAGLSFFWIKIPQTDNDLSLALKQMTYILPADSLDKYEEADPEEQKRFFISFWSKMDPNPHTEVNELMEEYFRRVNYADHKFKVMNSPGWRTDRGRILIKFGDPDEIERHPFEVDSVPYEIWRYYTLQRIFVFVDQTGFGDYRIAPEYLDQEYK